jgi:hypothetical protein
MFTRTDFLKPFRFATIGFSITVLFVVYQLLANLDLFSLREFLPMIAFAILCPRSHFSSNDRRGDWHARVLRSLDNDRNPECSSLLRGRDHASRAKKTRVTSLRNSPTEKCFCDTDRPISAEED